MRGLRVALLCGSLLLVGSCSSTAGSTGNDTYPAAWITADWSGGRTSTANDEKTQQGEESIGGIECLPKGITPILYDYQELLSTELLGDCPPGSTSCWNLVIANGCTDPVVVGVCVSAGSGGSLPQGSELQGKECAQDPLQTPINQLLLTTLAPQSTRNVVARTGANLSVNVFWCGYLDGLEGPPLQCKTLNPMQ